MSGTYGSYQLDAKAENSGAWVEFRDGIQIKLRSDNSDEARRWANKRARAQRQAIIAHGGILPIEQSDKNEIELCVQVLIVDWKGVTDREGKPWPYSADAARQLMTDLPALRREVVFAARSEETFREETAALGKISATSSAPSSDSAERPSS